MPDYIATGTDLTSVANAIRTKGGTESPLSFPDGFISAIEAIITGGGNVTLLDSGSYTNVSDSATMTIPFSTNGSPLFAYVVADSILEGVWQSYSWLCGDINYLPAEEKTAFPFMCLDHAVSNAGEYQGVSIPQNSVAGDGLNADTIVLRRHNASVQIKANTYRWYVWGV